MAKFKGKGVVVAGLLAGAASFLSKKENRDKAMEYLNQAKEKAGTLQNNEKVQGLLNKATGKTEDTTVESVEQNLEEVASTAGEAVDEVIEGNNMVDEGAQTTVQYYNEEQDNKPY